MKKIYLVSLSTLFVSSVMFGQNFTFVEGELIEKDIITEEFETAESKILNESGDAVVFEWEEIIYDNPFGWEFSLCDYASCYTGGETSGAMTEVPGESDMAFLKVNVYANSPGVGTYSYAVWDQAFPDDKDTITFVLTAEDESVGLEELTGEKVTLTTTASQQLKLSNISGEMASYSLINISGQTIKEGIVAAHGQTFIETNAYQPGIYFVAILNKEGVLKTEKIYIRQ